MIQLDAWAWLKAWPGRQNFKAASLDVKARQELAFKVRSGAELAKTSWSVDARLALVESVLRARQVSAGGYGIEELSVVPAGNCGHATTAARGGYRRSSH